MPLHADLPASADTVVIGAGTAGAALAGTLAARSDEQILVLEAGPDYGPFDLAAWPADLLDARLLATSHQWGYDSAETYPDRVLSFDRARVMGGCSAHNGCAAIVGHRLDYDAWAAAGCDGWSTAELAPVFAAALEQLKVKPPAEDDVTPFQRAFLEAAPAIGIPRADLNDWDEPVGIAPSPVNISGRVRWNAAFAWLDPVRDRPNLTIAGDAIVDRLAVSAGRVRAVEVIRDGRRATVECARVVLCGGAYGSPLILERSGIGDPAVLATHGIDVTHPLPGVGRNLHDHPAVELHFSGTAEILHRMYTFAQDHWLPEEQVIAKARSRHCDEGFDLHIYPVAGPSEDGWFWVVPVACMTPRSRGEIHVSGADTEAQPRIDHRFLSDPDGHDLAVLADGVRIVRELASTEPVASLIGAERDPLEAEEFVRTKVEHYYHPAGSCQMGASSDPAAVVDSGGRVHGLDGIYVADCAVCPTVPRANTNIPAAVIGLKVADSLLGA